MTNTEPAHCHRHHKHTKIFGKLDDVVNLYKHRELSHGLYEGVSDSPSGGEPSSVDDHLKCLLYGVREATSL